MVQTCTLLTLLTQLSLLHFDVFHQNALLLLSDNTVKENEFQRVFHSMSGSLYSQPLKMAIFSTLQGTIKLFQNGEQMKMHEVRSIQIRRLK